MEAQQVFDEAARHIFAQGRKSMNGVTCMYRSEDGLKCAVGYFISDDDYEYGMDVATNDYDGTSVAHLIKNFSGSIPSWFKDHVELLTSLQEVHDTCSSVWFCTETMRAALYDVATRFSLDPSALTQLRFKDR